MNAEAANGMIEAVVPSDLAGERADRAAARLFADHSRTMLTRLIKSGALTVDGQAAKPNRILNGGERLKLRPEPTPTEDWAKPQAVAFDIIAEDEDILVINKPPGVVVHPGAGNPDGTLVNGLLRHRPALRGLPRGGIVHRLDQGTSGLLVVAASKPAHARLVEAISQHRVVRRYLGVAEGVLTSGQVIDKPIGRDPHQRTKQQVREDGRTARTHVAVRTRFRAHTLFAAELETGRTHQIRVHMASIGHPLVGDRRYGARGRLPRAPHPEVMLTVRSFQRPALHAAELAFDHPSTGERRLFQAPPPKDFAELIAVLRQDQESHSDA